MTPPNEDRELARMEVLRAYKRHFGADAKANHTPFSTDGVIRYHTPVGDYDVPAIHAGVRENIRSAIRAIHHDGQSRIAVLAGDPGMGKSHLINFFRQPAVAAEEGYVLVCNPNHWKAGEFEECLLDWLITALVGDSPEQPHPLSSRIEDVAFQALNGILLPGEIARFTEKQDQPWWSRILALPGRLRRTTYEEVKSLAERRDPEVFRRLDFDRFAGHVCDRVLSRPGDPFQRYTMRVLLRYLFPEERELVQHWLRNKQVGDHFLHRIGARDAIDRKYKAVEVIKLLMSLFTGEVARGVAPPGKDRGLVFLLALDQAEGRAELFDSPSDWSDFFAQLAELYNSLPNVFVLFTMTIALFKELHARMEGQFRDRIRKDQRFILESIPDDEVLNLYRRRVDRWLGPKLANDLVPRREVAGNHYLPFTQVEVLEMSRRLPVRAMLEKFDAEFRRHLTEKVVSEYDVPFDYLCTRKEIATFGESMAGTDARFTEPHLQTVCSLFEQFGGPLAKSAGVEFQQVEWVVTDDYKLDCLQVTACAEGQPQHWVRLVIGRLPYRNFMERVPGCIRLVSGRGRHFKRHRLWLLRSPSLDAAQIDSRDGSVTALDLPPATETTLRAVLDTLKQRGKYPADAWDQGEQFLVAQVRQTYLGDVLTTARALIDQLQRALDAATDESAVLNTPAE